MTVPVLTVAANGHYFLTFGEYDTPQWQSARQWLARQQFTESGELIVSFGEMILPSLVKDKVSITAGADSWSGNYLLAECSTGDRIILDLAAYVAAKDRRSVA